MRFLMILAGAALLLAQHPPVEHAWDLLAQGKRQEAVQVLRKIVKTDPQDADARLLLGSILSEDGDRAGSIEQLDEAVRLRPNSAEAHNALGEAYNTFSETHAARGEFEKAVALKPGFGQAQVNLGLVLLEAGEPDAAAPHLDHAIQSLGHTEDAAYPHYLRAKVYTEHNQIEKAAEQLQEAVTLRPDFAEAWSDLGQARKVLLDGPGALAAFSRAVQVNPQDDIAQYRLGAAYLDQGKPHEAVLHLEDADRLKPGSQSTLYSLQRALRADGRPAEAEQVKQRLAEVLRERDKASQDALRAVRLNNEGAALEKAGNLRGALEKYRLAVQLYPEHVGLRVNYGVALLRLGHWREGIAELRNALRHDPNNTKLRKALADALAQAPPGTHTGEETQKEK